MICSWCNGTNEECGCGTGKCDHCDNGVVTDPPFGPSELRYCEELDILTKSDFEIIIDYDLRNIYQQIEFIPVYLNKPDSLTKHEIDIFKSYWDNPFRDENLGQVLNRVAWLVKNK